MPRALEGWVEQTRASRKLGVSPILILARTLGLRVPK
jgi:hypothetical protein